MNIMDKFQFLNDKLVHIKVKVSDDSRFANYVPLDKILTEPRETFNYYENYVSPFYTYTWWEELSPLTFKPSYQHYTGEEKCQPQPKLLSRSELIRSPKLWGELMSTAINSWRN